MVLSITGQTGDTIVEVLIAVGVLAFVLVGAYILSVRSTASTQDANERTQALKLVETQVEFLRGVGGITGGTCFTNNGTVTGDCTVTPNGPGTQPVFQLAIAPDVNGCKGSYSVQAVWGASDGALNNVSMCYRTGA